MKTGPRRLWECALASAALCVLTTAWAAEPTVRLEIGGEPAPENIQVLQRDGIPYLPGAALMLVGCGVESTAADRSAMKVTNGKLAAEFAATSAQAKVWMDGQAQADATLAQAPLVQDGLLYLPLSCLDSVLRIPCVWNESSKTARVGAPAPPPEDVQAWAKLLGLSNAGVFHQGGCRVRASMPADEQLPIDQELPLNVRTNVDSCVQIYIKNGDAPAQPLWGADTDGTVVRDPLSEGCPEKWRPARAWQVQHWRLRVTPGQAWVFAIATTAPSAPASLLEALKAGSAPQGEWAIQGIEVTTAEAPK